MGFEDVDWINLAQNSIQWQVVMNMEMNLLFP
jgi:hypothetical protein